MGIEIDGTASEARERDDRQADGQTYGRTDRKVDRLTETEK